MSKGMDYKFTNMKLKPKQVTLKLGAASDEEAITLLASLVNSVKDWDMRKFKRK